ncbi:hypothetical protein GWI33_021411 [Rhynchophorus ferrugineus]|uniref:Uncharacterized protein n=1 Tax=Rhynchophorus ferrugineus TaxID=354439 RepID=A0A834HPY1_RHYFE|nr:hypothetical protein GWI33_021411 [Rhynchophorus ferrugineus]
MPYAHVSRRTLIIPVYHRLRLSSANNPHSSSNAVQTLRWCTITHCPGTEPRVVLRRDRRGEEEKKKKRNLPPLPGRKDGEEKKNGGRSGSGHLVTSLALETGAEEVKKKVRRRRRLGREPCIGLRIHVGLGSG